MLVYNKYFYKYEKSTLYFEDHVAILNDFIYQIREYDRSEFTTVVECIVIGINLAIRYFHSASPTAFLSAHKS
jgi:hypothetical protein